MMTAAAALFDWRKREKLSQREVAAALDISPSHLSDIENGRRNLPDSLIDRVGAATPLGAALRKARAAEYRAKIAALNGGGRT